MTFQTFSEAKLTKGDSLKASHILVLAAAGLFGTLAHAQSTENFNLNVSFDADTCVADSSGNQSCQEGQNSIDNTNISVALSQCGDDGNGGQLCYGQWQQTVAVDSLTFSAVIDVSKDTDASGNATYSVVVGTGQQSGAYYSWTMVGAPNGMLASQVDLIGASIPSTTDQNTSYIPVVMVQSNSAQRN